MKKNRAWAAVYPDGQMAMWSVRPLRRDTMQIATEGMMGFREYQSAQDRSERWSYCYRRGARVVPVLVTIDDQP